jgi:hypothetical protein
LLIYVYWISLPPSSVITAVEGWVGPHEDGAIVFVVDPVPEVTIPCRVVVVRISGEFVIVDDRGRRSVSRCIDRGWGINWCRGDIGAAIDDRAAEIRPVVDWNTNSDVAKAGADIYLGIAFGSDKAAGDDSG